MRPDIAGRSISPSYAYSPKAFDSVFPAISLHIEATEALVTAVKPDPDREADRMTVGQVINDTERFAQAPGGTSLRHIGKLRVTAATELFLPRLRFIPVTVCAAQIVVNIPSPLLIVEDEQKPVERGLRRKRYAAGYRTVITSVVGRRSVMRTTPPFVVASSEAPARF